MPQPLKFDTADRWPELFMHALGLDPVIQIPLLIARTTSRKACSGQIALRLHGMDSQAPVISMPFARSKERGTQLFHNFPYCLRCLLARKSIEVIRSKLPQPLFHAIVALQRSGAIKQGSRTNFQPARFEHAGILANRREKRAARRQMTAQVTAQ